MRLTFPWINGPIVLVIENCLISFRLFGDYCVTSNFMH